MGSEQGRLMEKETISGFRLSPQQEHLWELMSRSGDSEYTSRAVVAIEGRLEAGELRRAVTRVVGRHEILRTLFRRLPSWDVPLQVVAEELAPSFEEVDLRGAEGESQWERQVSRNEEGGVGFDYERGPMVRVRLARTGEETHYLMITTPALCADTRSMENLVRETALAYEEGNRRETGGKGEGGEGIIQYADYAEWVNELKESGQREKRREKREEGEGAEGRGNEEEGLGRFRAGRIELRMEESLAGDVRRKAQSEGVRVDDVLMGGWAVLVWRLGEGAERLEMSVVCSGRRYEGLEEGIGLYERYVPVELRMKRGMRFEEVVREVREVVKEGREWQEYYGWEEEKGEGRGYVRYSYEEVEVEGEIKASGLRMKVERAESRSDRYEIKLRVRQEEEGIRGEISYDRRKVSEERARRMVEQYKKVVRRCVKERGARIEEVEVISEGEKEEIREYNRTRRDYGRGKRVEELIEEQAERKGEAIAVELSLIHI